MSTMGRVRSAIAHVLHVSALLVAFAVSLVASVLVNVNLPATRRLVCSTVTFLLGDVFEGKLIIEQVDAIGIDGVRGARVRVFDSSGAQVVLADGVNATAWVPGIVQSVASGSGEISIPISHVYIDWADVSLDFDSGSPRIARAFQPKKATKPSTGPGPGVKLDISEIAILHAWAHGAIPEIPPLDVDADDIRARLNVTAMREPTDEVHVGVGHVHLRSRNAPYQANLDGDAHTAISIPLANPRQTAIQGGYRGAIGGIPTRLRGALDGNKLDASVDVPRVEVDRVQAILPGAPLADLASAHVEAHGTVDTLDATARAQFGKGTVSAKAKVVLRPAVSVDGTFSIEHVDAQAFTKSAPPTDANATGKASIELKNGALVGTYEVDVAKGAVDKTPTPAARVEGKLGQNSITAVARVDEPGAPTTANAKLDLTKKTITFDVHASSSEIEKIPELKKNASGSADVTAHGTLGLTKGVIDAEFEAKGHHVRASGVSVRYVEARGHVSGPVATPTVDLTTRAHKIERAGLNVEEADGSAKVDIGPTVVVRDADVDVSTADEHLKLHADRVLTEKNRVKLEGATLDGLGRLIGVDAEEANGLLALSVHAHDIDLAKVARIFGASSVVRSGRVSINADVRLTSSEARGQVAIDVTRATVGPVDRGSAHFDATLLGKGIMANAHFDAPAFGRADVNTSTIQLNGSPLTPKAWEEATGDVQIDSVIQLKNFAPFLPPDKVKDLEGSLVLEGEIARTDPKSCPSISIDADTHGLVVAHAPDWRLDGVDVNVNAKLDGTGHAVLASKLVDAHGDLMTFNATSELPIGDLIAFHPRKEAVLSAPSTVAIEIPERNFDTFPAIVGFSNVKGNVAVSMQAHGTFMSPNFTTTVRVNDFRTPDLPLSLATSGRASLTYDGSVLDLRASVAAKKQKVLEADAHADVVWRDWLTFGASKDLPWAASAHATLTNFPLGSVTPLSDRGVKGNVSGEVTITDLHKNARANVQLAFDGLKVGKAKYTSSYARLSIDEKTMNGFFRIDQSDGYAEAQTTAGAIWGANIAPIVDPSRNVEATIDAKNVSAAVLQPFVDDYLNQLDGRVDAHAHATIPPTGAPRVEGTLALRAGVVQSPAIGEEFHDVAVRVTFVPDGNDTVAKVDPIVAYGTTGKILASASARMHGVHLVGANLSAVIPKDSPVQLTAQGEDYGEGYGNVNVKVDASRPNELSTEVLVPSFHVRVPEMSTRALQDLAPAENIRVGVQRLGRGFEPLALGAKEEATTPSTTQIDVDVKLGNDVDVRVGTTVRVQLDGGPHITIKDKTRVTGQFRLHDGKLDVQGKEFDVQNGGTITFTGDDPSNPDVVVTAQWTAPNGTIVYADFNGPLKTGHVTLRSEPPQSQNDILALILFGETDDTSQSASAGTSAASVAGGVATEGVNKAINQLTGVDATVRVDTSDSNNPRPEVQVQIAKDISLELATVIGATPFGVNPDRNLATVEWRFLRRWSLDTTFGDAGTSIVDVVWQYRY